MKTITKTVIFVIVLFVVFLIAGVFMATLEPTVVTDISLKQVNGSASDFENMRGYTYVRNLFYGMIFPLFSVVLFLIMFWAELCLAVKYCRNQK